MDTSHKGWGSLLLLLSALAALSGCAVGALGLAAGSGVGIQYAYDVPERTYNAPYDETYRALLAALEEMDIKAIGTFPTDWGSIVRATAPGLEASIEVERVSGGETKLTIDAKRDVIFKAKSQGIEILDKVQMKLEGMRRGKVSKN